MLVLQGRSGWDDVIMGRLHIYQRKQKNTQEKTAQDPQVELGRFHKAQVKVGDNLQKLYTQAKQAMGEDEAEIFQAQGLMLTDPDFMDAVEAGIKIEKKTAEAAVEEAGASFGALFAAMKDAYMEARANDVKDIVRQLVTALGNDTETNVLEGPVILASDDFTPSEVMQMDKSKVLACVLTDGSMNSHAAILANTLGIPAVVGLGLKFTAALQNKKVILDCFTGKVYISPDLATVERLTKELHEKKAAQAVWSAVIGKPSISKSGKKMPVYANISSPKNLEQVKKNDAEGVGLFRSEFLYLEREDYPSEEEQFKAYKEVLEGMDGKPVIIRTLDIGADKQVAYFHLPKENNPALGFRAIRICLEKPDVFKTQLHALLRASVYGKLSIMIPMIISLEELYKVKEYLQEVKESLIKNNIPFAANVPLGIMIETPAAALISEDLAIEADFFSIGSNDLTQYTLAVDRQNALVEKYADFHHPAILQLMKMTVENAHKAGITCGICGELGADTSLTKTFLEWGVDEVSVTPDAVLKVRRAIRES